MAIGFGLPCPKEKRPVGRRRKAREAAQKAFRNAVWNRAMAASDDGYAYCARCKRGPLKRTLDVLDILAGHVAHQRGRNVAPADRCNPDKADLVCCDCHLGGDHHMRFAR